MEMELVLIGLDGRVALEEKRSAARVTIGGGGDDDVHVPGLSAGAVEIRSDAVRAVLLMRGTSARVMDPFTRLQFDGRELRITLRPDAAAAPRRGGLGCPRCGGDLRDHAIGGAYRSVARAEQHCALCDTTLLSLERTASELGAIVDRSHEVFGHVAVPMACPQCGSQLLRAFLRAGPAEAAVERCAACHLVVLEPSDRAALTGDGT